MLGPVTILLIAVGGASGAVARYVVDGFVSERVGPGFPWGILIVNLSGAFVLGAFLTVVHHGAARAFFAVGVLGAYTTFSSLAMETVLLVKDHHAGLGVAYMGATIAFGLLSAWIGSLAARLLSG